MIYYKLIGSNFKWLCLLAQDPVSVENFRIHLEKQHGFVSSDYDFDIVDISNGALCTNIIPIKAVIYFVQKHVPDVQS